MSCLNSLRYLTLIVLWTIYTVQKHRPCFLRMYLAFYNIYIFRRHPSSALKMETVCSSETLVSTFKSTRRNNPEDQHHHLHRSENLKSHHHHGCYNPACSGQRLHRERSRAVFFQLPQITSLVIQLFCKGRHLRIKENSSLQKVRVQLRCVCGMSFIPNTTRHWRLLVHYVIVMNKAINLTITKDSNDGAHVGHNTRVHCVLL
jgi:hypothetical protein